MRGALVGQACRDPLEGIIPADAGSTILVNDRIYTVEDHPRGCGEHRSSAFVGVHRRGSSPRMRGAPHAVHDASHMPRIIPADAGSTVDCHCRTDTPGDHPRGCGEHEDQS